MESTRALAEFARRHVILFMELHTAAGDKKLYLFIPKHHVFVHLAERAYTNPILSWCYGEESQIGKAVKVCASLQRHHILRQLIPRYILTREWME